MNRGRELQGASGGFTLVELVVAMVLSSIVVGFAAMFLTAPVETYYTQTRRAELVESSDAIKRSLSNDLRRALPNSVRIRVAGTRAIVEMLVAEKVAYYDSTAGDVQRQLNIGSNDTVFTTLGSLNPTAAVLPPTITLDNRYRLVVNNRGIGGATAYQAGNVRTSAATRIQIANSAIAGEEIVTLTPGFRFGTASPSSRIYLISGPVSYICNSAANARTLRRYENYAITAGIPASEAAGQLTAAGVVNTVVARDVTACRLRCLGASQQPCVNTLVVDMTVSRAANAGNDFITVFAQLPVENTP